MGNSKKIDIVKAGRIKKTAEIVGVSVRSVQRVLAGDQKNDEVIDTYFDLCEQEEKAYETAKENYLLAAVEKLVPFTKS